MVNKTLYIDRMVILGIDPGLTGAFCLYDGANGWVRLFDMPTVVISKKGAARERKQVDAGTLYKLLEAGCTELGTIAPDAMFIEDVWSSPQMGVASAFSFGDSYGVCRGLLAGFCEEELVKVRPQVWKGGLKVPANKKESRERAAALFPKMADAFARVKDDGRAEASMIALYGGMSLGEKMKPVTEWKLIDASNR